MGFFGARKGAPGKGTHGGRDPSAESDAGVPFLPCTGDGPGGPPFGSSVNEPSAPTFVQGDSLRSSSDDAATFIILIHCQQPTSDTQTFTLLSRFLQQRPRRGRHRTLIACPFVVRSRANSRSCSVSWDCFILQSIYALGCQLVSSYGFNGLNAFAYGFSFGPANRVAQGSQASFLSRRQAIVIRDHVMGWIEGLYGSFNFNTVACACHLVAQRPRVIAP